MHRAEPLGQNPSVDQDYHGKTAKDSILNEMALSMSINALTLDNAVLQRRIELLEKWIADYAATRLYLRLSIREELVLRQLMTRPAITKEALHAEFYRYTPEHKRPDIEIVASFVFLLRRKLTKHKIVIKSDHHRGYYMEQSEKLRLQTILDNANKKTIDD